MQTNAQARPAESSGSASEGTDTTDWAEASSDATLNSETTLVQPRHSPLTAAALKSRGGDETPWPACAVRTKCAASISRGVKRWSHRHMVTVRRARAGRPPERSPHGEPEPVERRQSSIGRPRPAIRHCGSGRRGTAARSTDGRGTVMARSRADQGTASSSSCDRHGDQEACPCSRARLAGTASRPVEA